MSQPISVVECGGTASKMYGGAEDNHGYDFIIVSGVFNRVLDRFNDSPAEFHLEIDADIHVACVKDSLDMEEADRTAVKRTVEQAKTDHVVVIHGTDTIAETAASLQGIPDKTIVLTGSMQPEFARVSDIDLNLGMAIEAARSRSPGVYIALYGAVVPLSEYRHQ
jgi:L-asparaginase